MERKALEQKLTGFFEELHMHPELSYEEYETTERIKRELAAAGIEILQIPLKTGVTAIVRGADPQPILVRRRGEIERELAARQERLARIAFMLSDEGKGFSMNYQATIKDLPSCIVYSKTMTVPDFSAYNEVIPAIGRAVKAANPNLKCAAPEYCFITYLDGEYKERDITIKYSEAVEEYGVETDGIVFEEAPAVTVASVMHRGPYADLPRAYAFAMDWIEQNGYRASGLARESYIDGIWNCTDESQWLTEIQVPVEKK